jgi:hypothetical protein
MSGIGDGFRGGQEKKANAGPSAPLKSALLLMNTPMEIQCFPPIRDETANGWGTQHFCMSENAFNADVLATQFRLLRMTGHF